MLNFLRPQVSSDEEALKLMNDSPYGLTASVWTDPKNASSIDAFEKLADDLEGALFFPRLAHLMPAALFV